jgi:hypothetical protein
MLPMVKARNIDPRYCDLASPTLGWPKKPHS